MTNIMNAGKLLQDISDGINQHHQNSIACLEVIFYEDGEEVLKTGLPTALNYLANDIYWNEEGNWSLADMAKIKVM